MVCARATGLCRAPRRAVRKKKTAGPKSRRLCLSNPLNLAQQLQHGLLRLVGERQRGGRDRLAGGQRPGGWRLLLWGGGGQRGGGRLPPGCGFFFLILGGL